MESSCVVCGAPLDAAWAFCSKCGEATIDPNSVPENISAPLNQAAKAYGLGGAEQYMKELGSFVALAILLVFFYGVVKPQFEAWLRGQDANAVVPPVQNRASNNYNNPTQTEPNNRPRIRRTPGSAPRPGSACRTNDPNDGECELLIAEPPPSR